MAGNKLSTKTKTKDDRAKSNKTLSPANEVSEDLDCSVLRKPILTSVTGFAQARKVFDLATEELKSLLTTECDILYECKVCRNIFRSLANFISHKRIYCKESFDKSVHGHFVRTLSAASELSRIKKLEEMCNESQKEEDMEILNQKCYDDRIPLTKDLTEIIERLASSRGKQLRQQENTDVVLQKIPKTSVAVFQTIKDDDDKVSDLMKSQVKELNVIMSRENAVIHNDGTVEVQSSIPTNKTKEAENVIQISDDENNDDADILKCKICDLQFSSQKTLKFHMKYKHLESRLVYPCPDCLEIFSTSWSVYRHLFKVHRKTAAQVRRQRESIQAKAFRMNNPPAYYERRKNNAKKITPQKISEEERLEQENLAWMDNLEGDGEVPRCGGCGRSFERRAALTAHTHTCQPRSRALARRPPDSRKIEIQIRKDYNKAPPPPLTLPMKITESIDKQSNEKSADQPKLQREKENVPEQIEEEQSKENTPVSESLQMEETIDESQINRMKINEVMVNLPFARQTEKSNFNSFIKRCEPDIDVDKLVCKKCDTKFIKITDLYDHMAEHYKWLRYACKLCNFKHYNFEKLPEHVKVVHKLKGDSDFYYSTVKAIDGTEALQLSECSKDINDSSETSPNSRRPSRCSSDSSRLSDDSSSSSTRIEGTRKRKMKYNKIMSKKKKEEVVEDVDALKDSEASNDMLDESYSSNVKVFEENSSDIDEVDEKSTKKSRDASVSTISSRRPVRKRTNKKNEDFEYDLSNLLKMEAQGYRDSQTVVTTKSIPPKKKSPVDNNNIFRHDKDYCGALAILSRKAVANSTAHFKSIGMYAQSDVRGTNIFLRPLLPKVARIEKISPKKDTQQITEISSPNSNSEDLKSSPNASKDGKEPTNTNTSQEKPKQQEDKKSSKNDDIKNTEEKSSTEDIKLANEVAETAHDVTKPTNIIDNPTNDIDKPTNDIDKPTNDVGKSANDVGKSANDVGKSANDVVKPVNDVGKPAHDVGESSTPKLNVPTVVPLKLRRQSLDLMKNPLIKKNITDFSKAGMKTKILVIKPINRNSQQDGGKTINTPLKFQTIKLKDPNKSSSSSEVKLSDQVRVVQVPKVDRAVTLPMAGTCIKTDTKSTTAHNVKVELVTNTSDEKKSETQSENEKSNVLKELTPKTLTCSSAEKEVSSSVNNIISRTKKSVSSDEKTLTPET